MLVTRTLSSEDIRRHERLLKELEDDFERLNRRTVSLSLRSSMITRIGEVRGYVNNGRAILEKQARRGAAKGRRKAAAG